MRSPDGVFQLASDLFRWCWHAASHERKSTGVVGSISPCSFSFHCTGRTLEGNQDRKHSIELRLSSRSRNRRCSRTAFVDCARCCGVERAPQLVKFARLATRLCGINYRDRHIFPVGDRRASRRQTTNDSETYRAGAADRAPHYRWLMWRVSLRISRTIVSRRCTSRWNRRRRRRLSWLRRSEEHTSELQSR